MNKRDLFVVVADLDAEKAIGTLLCERQRALGVHLEFNRAAPTQGDLLRYSGRDSGCFRYAVKLLRSPQLTHSHALLIFDQHGSGAEMKSRKQIEAELEGDLHASGWPLGDAAVVVIDPELEAWVWTNSPHLSRSMGWGNDRDGLRPFLSQRDLWDANSQKPNDPKEALAQALRAKQKPAGAALFSELAATVSVQHCEDSSFRKFQQKLREWFPLHQNNYNGTGRTDLR